MRSSQKQSADQGVRNGKFMEAIIALDEVDENLALCLLNLIPAAPRCFGHHLLHIAGVRCAVGSTSESERKIPPSTLARTDVLGSCHPNTSAHPFITSTQQALCRDTNSPINSSLCRHHPCPRPAFTPFPTYSPTPRVQRQHFPRPTAGATPPPAPRPAASSPAGLYSASDRTPLGTGTHAPYHQRPRSASQAVRSQVQQCPRVRI